ncbi:MAG: NAD(P)-dependent oxidoreductase [Candidatus Roseilinea sp.]|nr:MAG: NAD(P)-dependent oxidoreductase [Candidatus Roseilinea sp.]
MFGLLAQLKALREPIRVAVAGIGATGRGLLLQSTITPGIRCVAIADIRPERAISAAERFKCDYRVVHTLDEMHDAIAQGKLAICEDGNLVAHCELLDVFIEATSSIPAGGRHAITALESGKHVVMMNYEADLLFGPWLAHLAEDHGRVYTVCDGDQPTVLKRLIDEVALMGFKLVMAGNIKGYLDRYANPTTIIPEADKRGLDYRMCASFTDGTKLCVEMAVLANGLGLRTATPGMFGPRAVSVLDVFDKFDFDEIWDGERGLVDYILGAEPKGGVFIVGYNDDAYQQEVLATFPSRLGAGPYYVFTRPYHLVHFEAMASVAEAALNRRAVLKPDFGFRTNVYAYAKRDLRQGETLDGVGGYTCYGLIENCDATGWNDGLPICLADGAVLKRDVSQDERILWDDVALDRERFDVQLFRQALEESQRVRV